MVEPAIVIGSSESGQLQRFPAPGFSGDMVEILGEETVTGRNQLVVVFEQALWALDRETGEWDGPLTGPRDPFPGGIQRPLTLSASGDRAYSVAQGSLATFEFIVDEDADAEGALDILVTTRPINFNALPSPETRVLYADDNVVFIEDERDLWSLEAPPRSDG